MGKDNLVTAAREYIEVAKRQTAIDGLVSSVVVAEYVGRLADEIERLTHELCTLRQREVDARRVGGERFKEIEQLRKSHNGEVCVDVQEYCEKLEATNRALREKLAKQHINMIACAEMKLREFASRHVMKTVIPNAEQMVMRFGVELIEALRAFDTDESPDMDALLKEGRALGDEARTEMDKCLDVSPEAMTMPLKSDTDGAGDVE